MAENTANIRVTANEQEVDQLARSVDRLGDELGQADREAQGLGTRIATVASGMLTAEVAMRAAELGMRALTASFEAFAASSIETQQAQERLSDTIEDAARRFGRSVFGDGRAADVMNNFSAAIQEADLETNEFVQTLQGLLELMDLAITAQRYLNLDVEVFGMNLRPVRDLVANTLNPFRGFSQTVQGLGNAWEAARDRFNIGPRIDEIIGKTTDEIKELNEVAGTPGTFFSDFVRGRLETGLETARDLAPAAPAGAGAPGETVEERTARAAAEGLATIQRLNQQNNEELRRLDEAAQARKDEIVEAERIRLEKQAELLAQRNEQQRKADEIFLEQQQAFAEKQFLIAQIAQEKRERLQQRGVEGIVSLNNSLLSIEGKNAKERRRALRAALGNEMVTKGQAFIAEAAATAIINPARAIALGIGGTALVAAGTKFAAGGGGGGGGRTAPPRQSITNQNVVFNQQTQFGFVGDRRAATREIEDLNRASIERGLT